MITNDTCTDKYLTYYKFKIQMNYKYKKKIHNIGKLIMRKCKKQVYFNYCVYYVYRYAGKSMLVK